ncbi:hypothetical protein [Streptomyces sp. NPDC015125]|uniref:hypothetical protein n=1 Tax=Streptomyces sp. NPDC015125 TaxID=3364938 RepID=UPI0036FE631B
MHADDPPGKGERPRLSLRALCIELGRPFKGGFFVAREIVGGSVTLIGMGFKWLFEDGVSSAGGRALLVGIGVYVAGQELNGDSVLWGWGVCAGFLAWLAAAWIHSPHRQDGDAATARNSPAPRSAGSNDAGADEVNGSDMEESEEVTPEMAKQGLIDVIAYTAEQVEFRKKKRGVHLSEILENLHARQSLLQWDVIDLRVYCEKQLGVEIQDVNRKEGGKQKNRPGIRYKPLCKLLESPIAPARAREVPAEQVPDLTPKTPLPGDGTPPASGAADPPAG